MIGVLAERKQKAGVAPDDYSAPTQPGWGLG
jgi:hypothetical protein